MNLTENYRDGKKNCFQINAALLDKYAVDTELKCKFVCNVEISDQRDYCLFDLDNLTLGDLDGYSVGALGAPAESKIICSEV